MGGKKRKEQPHAQSFKGTCGNSYGKGGREAHVGLPLSDPDVQAMVLKMPVKGSRACWARLSVFLSTKKYVKSVAGSFPLWLNDSLGPCWGLCHTSYTQAELPWGRTWKWIGLVHWITIPALIRACQTEAVNLASVAAYPRLTLEYRSWKLQVQPSTPCS